MLTVMVALWGAPSAAGLFRALIMQSDPMVRRRPSVARVARLFGWSTYPL